jgi:hypothetical protein
MKLKISIAVAQWKALQKRLKKSTQNLRSITMLDFRNSWDFPIESQPIYDQLGHVIEGHQSIVRTDTNESLGVHGSRYKAVSHQDVVDSVVDGIKTADLSKDYDLYVDVKRT